MRNTAEATSWRLAPGRLVLLSSLALGGATGCIRHHPLRSGCEWPVEGPPPIAVDLKNSSQKWHLSADAEFAEDIAIRYADRLAGPGSGNFENMAQYQRTRDGCMTLLFRSIAMSHSVTEQDVRRSLGRGRISFDLAVMFSFALVFAFGVSRITRAVIRTHLSNNGWVGTLLMVAFVAIAASLAGLMIGEQWCATLECLRLDTGHLSYRGERLPWIRYRVVVFWTGVLLVSMIAAVQWRRARAVTDKAYRSGAVGIPGTS
jgi:hypothetical protein